MATPIKVLQLICPSGFYGAERWILALANNLDPQQVRCDLAVTREANDERAEISDRFQAGEGRVFDLSMKHRFDPGVVSRLCRLIRERDIDVIHTHGYKSDILGVIAARRTSIKSVCTPHGFENDTDLKLRFYLWLGGRTFRHFDALAPLSPQLCDDILDYAVDPARIRYIQNGVDLTEVETARDNDDIQPKTHKRIGYIGQLISRKNVRHLIEVFDRLWQRHPDTELCLIGDGEERPELERLASSLPSAEQIRFLGFRDDRLTWLKSFDLFAMTSTLEGIPRCLMEAMAMEVPVAAYRIPGVDRLIISKETGLLAPLNDQDALLGHWECLLFDESVSRPMIAHAREQVLARFSARRMADEYTRLFQDLLAGAYAVRGSHV